MGFPTAASRLLQRTLAALLPLGLAAALVPALMTSPAPDAATAELRPVAAAITSPTYKTFTLNVKFSNNAEQTREDMARAMTLGDAGGFQELSDSVDRATLIALCAEKDWGYYMPPEGGLAIPIVWNRARFRLIDGHTTFVHGPVGSISPSRYINVVRLREVATGKVFGMINTHMLTGASRDAQLSNMQLIPYLRLHLQLLRGEIQALFKQTEHVFVSGDFNVNYLADRTRKNPGLPTDALGDLVNFDMPIAASFGTGSLLDYGLSIKEDGGLAKTSSEIVPGFHSDHRAIAFSYTPVDLFATGPLFSSPKGDVADRQRSVTRQARAVNDAEAGQTVRLVTSRLDAPELEGALTAAYARGVAVRVVTAGTKGSGAEDRLAALLGSDRAAPSWLTRCVGSCLGGTGKQQANVLLVSLTGGTSELTLVASAAPTKGSFNQWTDVFRSSNPAVYAAYGALFDKMALDTTDTSGKRVLNLGTYQLQLYPVPNKPHRDPVLKPLQAVGCTKARGIHTGDGRTNVRVSVNSWSGQRGKAIAAALVGLRKQGCDVAVLTGPKVLSGIRKTLTRGDIAVRSAKIGQNVLVVDGRYGKRANRHYVWTGGPGWTDGAITGDGATLVVSRKAAVADYLAGFSAIWARS